MMVRMMMIVMMKVKMMNDENYAELLLSVWVSQPELCLIYFKKKINVCRWECISSESSRLLLNKIKPKLVLSGSRKLLSFGC